MPAHIIPSKREAYAAVCNTLETNGDGSLAEVLRALLYDADRVASLVAQVATLTEQVDSLTTEVDNLRVMVYGRADGDLMAGVEPDWTEVSGPACRICGSHAPDATLCDECVDLMAEQAATEARSRDSLSIAS